MTAFVVGAIAGFIVIAAGGYLWLCFGPDIESWEYP